jgi:exodeoxyribonuclease VII large subunit
MDSLFEQPNIFACDKVYTVLELNQEARQVLRKGFSQQVWVCGEIQNLRVQRGKNHMYFSLVQKDPESDNILAQVDANLFAGIRQNIEKRIASSSGGFELKNDIEVKFLCEVDLYAPRGKFNLNIKDIDPVYTLGKVAQNRLKIIADLRKRGLLDRNKTLTEIPLLPLQVGLITAQDSAAYHDFTNELSLSGWGFKVLVYNSHMQGKMVEADIIKALKYFSRLGPQELDVVVVTRGGGSTADLSYFDNKKIAETIAELTFPVISAVGHQIDSTVIDLVANTACKTPTKAAQFLVDKVKEVAEELDRAVEILTNKSRDIIEISKGDLRRISIQLESSANRYFIDHREGLVAKKHLIAGAVKLSLSKESDKLNNLFEGIKTVFNAKIRQSNDLLKYAKEKIRILDPKNTLKRGYSITVKNGKSLRGANDVSPGDDIKTVLYDGSIISRVKSNHREEA